MHSTKPHGVCLVIPNQVCWEPVMSMGKLGRKKSHEIAIYSTHFFAGSLTILGLNLIRWTLSCFLWQSGSSRTIMSSLSMLLCPLSSLLPPCAFGPPSFGDLYKLYVPIFATAWSCPQWTGLTCHLALEPHGTTAGWQHGGSCSTEICEILS